MDMVLCLIEVNKSVVVIENAIVNALKCHSIHNKYPEEFDVTPGFIGHYTLTLIYTLLKADPEAE